MLQVKQRIAALLVDVVPDKLVRRRGTLHEIQQCDLNFHPYVFQFPRYEAKKKKDGKYLACSALTNNRWRISLALFRAREPFAIYINLCEITSTSNSSNQHNYMMAKVIVK